MKVVIFGDSVAWRVGFAMLASQPQNSYDVNIFNGAIIGCGVLRSSEYLAHGVADPMASQCNPSTPKSGQWPAQWTGDLRQFHPNVVVLLAGRWELEDRLIGGQWLHIGDPEFDADLRASLEQAVDVATSTGALMVMMTSPCFDSGEQDNGQPWPEDSATRLAEYNAMVRQVAAQHPATVQLDDFGAQLCPGGNYTTSFDGIQIRDGDGVHIVPTAAAGQWLDARVLPDVVRLGRLADGRRQADHADHHRPRPRPPLSTVPARAKGWGPADRRPAGRPAESRRGPAAGSMTAAVAGRRWWFGRLALRFEGTHQGRFRYPIALRHGGHQGLPLAVVVGRLGGDGERGPQLVVRLLLQSGCVVLSTLSSDFFNRVIDRLMWVQACLAKVAPELPQALSEAPSPVMTKAAAARRGSVDRLASGVTPANYRPSRGDTG